MTVNPQPPSSTAIPAVAATTREFSILRQKLYFEFDFLHLSVKGETEITLVPQSKALRQLRINCRQCEIQSIFVQEKPTTFVYNDPYKSLKPRTGWDIRQNHLIKERLETYLGDNAREELTIDIPKKVLLREATALQGMGQENSSNKARLSFANSTDVPSFGAELQANYQPITVKIGFTLKDVRDGIQFVGLDDADNRYPHIYTRNIPHPGSACCLFPCVDDLSERHEWEITIKCPKTLGDALGLRNADPAAAAQQSGEGMIMIENDDDFGLSEAERALELQVVCSGQLDDESIDPLNPTQKRITFSTRDIYCSANQIGFAIGPFEQVDLSDLREVDEDEKLAEDAAQVIAYCLPGRAEEVKNTALPMAKAVDFFTERFTKYFYPSYHMCFLDDLATDTAITTGLSFISTRLLYPSDIIDPIYDNTYKVVSALAAQYSGIGVTAREAADNWCIIGMEYFMADAFMKHLCGNNEYRLRQKLAVDRIFELDRERPSLHNLGSLLQLDPTERDFVALKAATVLFILDRRLTKSSTSSGVARVINRTMTNTKGGDAEATLLSTAQFQKTCERTGHTKLDSFFNQWVYGAGCPNFRVSQRFNKKKLVVEMIIEQIQNKTDTQQPSELNPSFFLRDVNEDLNEIWASQQSTFTGPMTIRIHEADGTPYEHIVDIKEATQKLEIPYNTKYKRLKRNRRQKEKQGGERNTNHENTTGEDKDDVLLHCLGDVLQSEEDIREWKFQEWTPEQEKEMSDDSYEWIRMDADFEWICKMSIQMQPWMFVSQLQQDRDVVAQYESLQYMGAQTAHPLISTFLTRTIMDSRYFHGIRTYAISLLPKLAQEKLGWIGLVHLQKVFSKLFCGADSVESLVARANDFSSRQQYIIQCALPRAMAKVRNVAGIVPMAVKRFLVDALKFNDNSQNEYSDCYWVTTLMLCLAEAIVTLPGYPPVPLNEMDQQEEDELCKDAISEIERHRRIDEWVSSFQNVFSVTALKCLLRLSKSDVLQPRLADFLQYTRSGNADLLRLQAFECLTEVGKMKNGPVLKHLLHSMSNDHSPYVREQLWSVFGRGLGTVAVGQDKSPKPTHVITEGLIVDEGAPVGGDPELARKTTIEGAMTALKTELGDNQALQAGLWDAITSTTPSLREVWKYLTIPEFLYDVENKLFIKLKYPRYWKVRYEGNGILRFTNDGKVRTQRRDPPPGSISTIKISKPVGPSRKPSMKISLGRQPTISSGMDSLPSAALATPTRGLLPSMPPPSQRPSPATERPSRPEQTSEVERKPSFIARSLIVKLKVPKMRNPEYVASLAAIIPRTMVPSDHPPKKLKINTNGTIFKRESTSPSANTADDSFLTISHHASPPSEQRRLSTASSRSSGSGIRGGKRKSSDRDLQSDYFTQADGTLSPQNQRKRQKTGRNSHSAGNTPAPQYAPISTPTPTQQFGAWDGAQYAPVNDDRGTQYGAWNDSTTVVHLTGSINGNANDDSSAVRQCPSRRRKLIVKLKIPKSFNDRAVSATNCVPMRFAPIGGDADHVDVDGAADAPVINYGVNGSSSPKLHQESKYAPKEWSPDFDDTDEVPLSLLRANGNQATAAPIPPSDEQATTITEPVDPQAGEIASASVSTEALVTDADVAGNSENREDMGAIVAEEGVDSGIRTDYPNQT